MGIIGYKDEIVTNTTNVPMTDNFNFYVTGQSTDSAAAAYTIDTSTSLSNGIVIGTDAVAWDKVTDENGDVITCAVIDAFKFEEKEYLLLVAAKSP